MERFINILVIEDDPANINALEEIIIGGGNNLIFCADRKTALSIVEKQDIGIILINVACKNIDGFELLKELQSNSKTGNTYKIIISNDKEDFANFIQGFRRGAVDYITTPFNPKLVQAKIEVFKNHYFKSLRIHQLLLNIFPPNILQELNTKGKFTPRKVEKGVVLFTDFVAFTKLSKNTKPIALLKELEVYFQKFDEITERYKLEKIKTIGDAYMALAGVTESNNLPAIRATLAAIEMRDFVLNRKEMAKASGENSWDIRIGMHSGPLVAGVIGGKKMSFDVWGDTVNIASRAEQNSIENNITITSTIAKDIKQYFDILHRGQISIKYGDFVDMYFVQKLKRSRSMFNEGKLPNRTLRVACDLFPMDFEFTRQHMINKLKSSLPDNLDYHNIKHTLNVEKAAIRLAKLEGIVGEDFIILRTAVIFHDAGYILQFNDNEEVGKQLARTELPKFGYDAQQIDTICEIINKTKRDVAPQTLLQKIMCDADLDYLGRADYYIVARTLRNELENYGTKMTEKEWLDYQLHYLEDVHQYYTQTSKNIRNSGKQLRIEELKARKSTL